MIDRVVPVSYRRTPATTKRTVDEAIRAKTVQCLQAHFLRFPRFRVRCCYWSLFEVYVTFGLRKIT